MTFNSPTYYEPPEDLAGTVFDPHSTTFGPIMAAIHSGDFERAARLLTDLAEETSAAIFRVEVDR